MYRVSVLFVHMFVHSDDAMGRQKKKEGIKIPENGVINGFEPPCGCLKHSQGPVYEQLVLLAAGLSLYPYFISPLTYRGN